MGGDQPLNRIPSFVYTSVELRAIEHHLIAIYGKLSSYREKLRMFLAKPA